MEKGGAVMKATEAKSGGRFLPRPSIPVTANARANGGGALSVIIDPMLLAGGMTTKEIAAELAKKVGDAGKGKDLEANVRARMVSYTRKGWKVVKDDKKRVRVTQKKS
jgi:hypothetical protein